MKCILRMARTLPAFMLALVPALWLLLAAGAPAAAQTPPPVDPASVPALIPLSGVARIATGSYHSCALTTAGGVKCWGFNGYGQLGDGTSDNRLTPVDVSGLTSGVQAVSASYAHSCALTTAGGVKCWGSNSAGQLGDGTTTDRLAPVDVSGLSSGVQAISAGASYTCALTTAGGVKCWGYNGSGQLGNGSVTSSPTPVDVSGLTSGVQAISAGADHICATMSAGGAKCWGYNGSGQLGDGGVESRRTPVDVSGLAGAVQGISAGDYHTCAITTAGGAKCWGENGSGQLGDGSIDDKLTPVDVSWLTGGVQTVVAGQYHSCALTTAGNAKCWGKNGSGQLGDGTKIDSTTQVDVSGLGGSAQAIATGANHSCALTTAGNAKCWGHNSSGQLGDGTTAPRTLPGDVLVPRTCFTLARAHTGSGGNPRPDSPASPGCPPNTYLSGARLVLTAIPAAGQRVQAWGAPAQGEAGATLAALTMPAADSSVTVAYAPCHTLTLAHSGSGGNPQPAPAASRGCAAGRYAAGERLVLVAVPAANQRVQLWSGAAATPATGSQVNTLTMPAAEQTVSVTYEGCHALATTVEGQGQPPSVGPATSQGCLTGGYAAGESLVLTAAPAAGWQVVGWQGTADDASQATTNVVTMPGGSATVGVVYGPLPAEQLRVYLPAVQR